MSAVSVRLTTYIHDRVQGPHQNDTVVEWVGYQIDGKSYVDDRSDSGYTTDDDDLSLTNGNSNTTSTTKRDRNPNSNPSSVQSRLDQAARGLAQRERKGGETLYHQKMVRYDDCTAIIMHLRATQL